MVTGEKENSLLAVEGSLLCGRLAFELTLASFIAFSVNRNSRYELYWPSDGKHPAALTCQGIRAHSLWLWGVLVDSPRHAQRGAPERPWNTVLRVLVTCMESENKVKRMEGPKTSSRIPAQVLFTLETPLPVVLSTTTLI